MPDSGMFQYFIISQASLTFCYLLFTGLAHKTEQKFIIVLAHWARFFSLWASAGVITLIFANYALGAVVLVANKHAVFGVMGLLFLVWLNLLVLEQYNRLTEVVIANILIAISVIMFKLQVVAFDRPPGPEGMSWMLYGVFYLSSWIGLRFMSGWRLWFNRVGQQLQWVDAYALPGPSHKVLGPSHYEDLARRYTCGLCFSLLNVTSFINVNGPILSLVALLLLCQFCVTLVLALRYASLCPNATLEDGFVISTYKQLGASIAKARTQRLQGFLPEFRPWLFVIVLFCGLHQAHPAHCSSGFEEEVASPVAEGVQASRGASLAGEAYQSATQWANAHPHAANLGIGVASGAGGTLLGEGLRQVALPDPLANQAAQSTQELTEQMANLSQRLQDQNRLEQLLRDRDLVIEDQNQRIEVLEQQMARNWGSVWSQICGCFGFGLEQPTAKTNNSK